MSSPLDPAVFEAAVAAAGEAILITGSAAAGHPILHANAAFLEMTGYAHEDLVGRNARLLQGADSDPAVIAAMRVALDQGQAFRGETINYRKDGRPYRVAWLITPARDAGGDVTNWVSIQRDVTALRAQEGQLQLLVRELHHRVKNSLATVQALVNATMRSSTTMAAFRDTFAGRLTSLARTHTLLFDGHGTSTTMRDILCAELSPYDDDSPERIWFDGPDVPLTADQALAIGMAIHELTTNAVKYGALSTATGQIAVTWSYSAAGGLVWSWTERGGPPVEPPSRQGFGTRLLHRVLCDQLQAQIDQQFEISGLQIRIQIPSYGS